MRRGENGTFIWQRPDWPAWRLDYAPLIEPLLAVSSAHGRLQGRLDGVGLDLRQRVSLGALTDDVIQTSAIEGEDLPPESVRSSIARRLGVDIGALAPADRHVDGVVDMVLDATTHADQPLTLDRLHGWHAALFPTGRSGFGRTRVGDFRDDANGPMQVVSGPLHAPRVHFEAPSAERLPAEIARLLDWVDAPVTSSALHDLPALLRAGIAHLWFVTLHPYDDGNGRIARAIGDLLLSRADGMAQRVYSLSAQIQQQRAGYYAILERTQRGDLDVTAWLHWFLQALRQAVDEADRTLDEVLARSRFWQGWSHVAFNERQLRVLARLLDGFEGALNNRKWAALARCSPDTALRDLNDLLARGVIARDGGGRSVSYRLVMPGRSDSG
ncbi:Fic family protein [Sphaerotilus mobilis]|uniref:Fic family protein n=1 Tax=Sphaerotilus mobilis TaxID=47994 RepID=A0A4Q7LRY7_9BURK|nr:Fic family protein [Sphaerotilus mobilis]RZS56588.1 Fic family protein [Sphaerotilus mobilis]